MPVSNDKLTFITAVVCDDIRREDSGKELLIGVYSSEIIVPTVPIILVLSFWIPIEINRPGKSQGHFRIVGTDSKVVHDLPPLDLEFSAAGTRAALSIGGIGVPMLQPGTVRLDARLDEMDWKELKLITVQIKGELPPSSL
jgi:hypothetical protein